MNNSLTLLIMSWLREFIAHAELSSSQNGVISPIIENIHIVNYTDFAALRQ